MRKLLARITIGVPTYNRSDLLKKCLASLDPILESLHGQVDLLVSDNSSNDGTQDVLRSFEFERRRGYSFRSIRQTENIGAVPNIFALIEACSTDYLIFIGDDDALSLDGLRRLLVELDSSPASHLIEGTWPWRDVAQEVKVHLESSGAWGYEIGLAWSSVYNVEACQEALQIPGLKAQLGQSIWGQIGLALTSIQRANLLVRVMPFSWGYVDQERPYRYGYANLLLSFRDLIRSHRDAYIATGQRYLLTSFLSMRNHGYKSHILGILIESSTLKKAELKNEFWIDLVTDAAGLSKTSHLLTISLLRFICLSPLRLLIVPLRSAFRFVSRS